MQEEELGYLEEGIHIKEEEMSIPSEDHIPSEVFGKKDSAKKTKKRILLKKKKKKSNKRSLSAARSKVSGFLVPHLFGKLLFLS